MNVLIHFPKTRLSELVRKFGGLSRDDAVAAATSELETLRLEADSAILTAIAQLEKMVAADKSGGGEDAMKELLPVCDQIVTLAGTYGYGALDKATRSLCDLLDGLIGAGTRDRASIRVHVQTIRMMAPGSLLGPEQVEVMLFELTKLLDHHGFSSLSDGTRDDEFAVAAR